MPDVDIRGVGEGQLQVEIRGLDTYNPTNGKVINHYGDEILKVYEAAPA